MSDETRDPTHDPSDGEASDDERAGGEGGASEESTAEAPSAESGSAESGSAKSGSDSEAPREAAGDAAPGDDEVAPEETAAETPGGEGPSAESGSGGPSEETAKEAAEGEPAATAPSGGGAATGGSDTSGDAEAKVERSESKGGGAEAPTAAGAAAGGTGEASSSSAEDDAAAKAKAAAAAKAKAEAAAKAKAAHEAAEAAKEPWERDPVVPEWEEADDDPLVESLRDEHPESIESARTFAGDLTLEIRRDDIRDVCASLKSDQGYILPVDICGNHYPEREEGAFEVVYHLYNFDENRRIRLKVRTDEGEEVPSVTPVWVGANWHERETYDMYGIRFAGHPDMTRILLWEGFNGYPLRKDFPVEGIDTGSAIYPEYYEEEAGPIAGTGTGWKAPEPPEPPEPEETGGDAADNEEGGDA